MNIKIKKTTVALLALGALLVTFVGGQLRTKAVMANDNFIKNSNEGIPVLMYHSIDNEIFNPMKVSKEKFEEQMKFLKDNGYTTLTLDELYGYFINRKNIPQKSLVLTFDDGYRDNYTNAYPILKKYGLKATIFVITGMVDKGNAYVTSGEMKEMAQNGIEIEGHTYLHEKLNKLSYEAQLKTLVSSKKFIENITGKSVYYMAYPFGMYNEDTIVAAKKAGYKMAFIATGKWAHKSNGIYALERIYVSKLFNMREFQERLTDPDFKPLD